MDMSYPAWNEISPSNKCAVVESVFHNGDSARTLARAINERFGYNITRNAIIGLYTRQRDLAMKCPLGRTSADEKTAQTVKDVQKRIAIAKKQGKEVYDLRKPQKKLASQIPVRNVTLMELGKHECHWPMNDGGPFLYCGCKTRPTRSFCDDHHAIGFYKPEVKV